MKIIGKPIGTVFPKSEIEAKICDYRYGAVAALSHTTDSYYTTSRYAAELYGFMYNMTVSIFGQTFKPKEDISGSELSGRVWWDIYHQTDRWRDLSYDGDDINKRFPVIPDYLIDTWTEAGEAVFPEAVAGEPKPVRYPMHGQEMYNASNGAFGFSYETGEMGQSNLRELYDLVEFEQAHFGNEVSRKISAFAYRMGRSGGSHALYPKYLCGRNSGYSPSTADNAVTWGGKSKYDGAWLGYPTGVELTRANLINRPSATRWWDSFTNLGETEEAISIFADREMRKTVLNRGWYQDFIHWHNCYDAGDLGALGRIFNIWDNAIENNHVWRAGYGEIAEYLFYRELINRVSTYEHGNKVYIVVHKKDVFKNKETFGMPTDTPLDELSTPISIEVDLTGTYLDGKNIKTNGLGIKSLGNNKYIVDIPFSNAKEGYVSVFLEETINPDYYVFDKPVIISAEMVGNTLTVITDRPTTCVLFSTKEGEPIHSALMLRRSNLRKTSHIFYLDDKEKIQDIYIGVVTIEEQSILSDVYNFNSI